MQVTPAPRAKTAGMNPRGSWTFFSNHAHVLIALAKDPELRVRDLAEQVGITERAVAQILADLQEARVLTKRRVGRRNVYLIDVKAPLRHPVESHGTVADILRLAEVPTARRVHRVEHRTPKRV